MRNAWKLIKRWLYGNKKWDGLRGFQPSHWPLARVKYTINSHGYHDPEHGQSFLSELMPIGNAKEYARIFKGEVVYED